LLYFDEENDTLYNHHLIGQRLIRPVNDSKRFADIEQGMPVKL
jgi:hypothetical protein